MCKIYVLLQSILIQQHFVYELVEFSLKLEILDIFIFATGHKYSWLTLASQIFSSFVNIARLQTHWNKTCLL